MSDKISKEIKDVAKVARTVSIILSILSGIALLVISFTSDSGVWFFLSIIVVVAGCFGARALYCLIYGFGLLIDHAAEIAKNTRPTDAVNKTDKAVSEGNADIPSSAKAEKCDMCGKENVILTRYVINDDSGTHYRKLCAECQATKKTSDTK